MLKLIKLELKKFKTNWYVNGALIATLFMAIVMSVLPYVERTFDNAVVFQNYSEAFHAINTAQSSIFIVFASVLIAKLIIDEYKFKTITVLFTYPISRKKMMTAKLLLIVLMTFVTILISSIVVTVVFITAEKMLNNINEPLTFQLLTRQVIGITTTSLAASGIGLIPLFFGMLRKSVPVTIVTSLIVVSVLGFDLNNFQMEQIIAIPLTFCTIGIIVAYIAVRNIDKQDLI
ncbi:ABC transporter permease [Halobacillus rhizosphaerae]|uniref:ABC transporter permease n=1 Tax=Halobacillus rhizosphaerae TaxID=3064889 RepID=UPI00398A5289